MSRDVVMVSGGQMYYAVDAAGQPITTASLKLMSAISGKRKFGKGRLISMKRIYQHSDIATVFCVEICEEMKDAVTAKILSWNGYMANINVDLRNVFL